MKATRRMLIVCDGLIKDSWLGPEEAIWRWVVLGRDCTANRCKSARNYLIDGAAREGDWQPRRL